MIEKAEVKKFATVEELIAEVKSIRQRTQRAWVFLPNSVIAQLDEGHTNATPSDKIDIWGRIKHNGEEITFNVREPEEAYFFSLE